MEEFFKRLKSSTLSVLKEIFTSVLSIALIAVLILVIFVLPTWLLSFVVGEYSTLWIFIALFGIILWSQWEKIKDWFIWQFIEPFKK